MRLLFSRKKQKKIVQKEKKRVRTKEKRKKNSLSSRTSLASDATSLPLHLLRRHASSSTTSSSNRTLGTEFSVLFGPGGLRDRLKERVEPSLLRLCSGGVESSERRADSGLVEVLLADEELDDALDVRFDEFDRGELVERRDGGLCCVFLWWRKEK